MKLCQFSEPILGSAGFAQTLLGLDQGIYTSQTFGQKAMKKIIWQYFSGTFSTKSCHTTSNIIKRNNLYSVQPLNRPENQLCICNSDTDVRKSKRGCPDNGPVIRSISKLFHHSHVRGCLNQLTEHVSKKFLKFIFFFTKDLLKRICSI